MNEVTISTMQELDGFIKSSPVTVIYYSTPDCNVCKVLKPKLKELLDEDFPEVEFGYVDLNNAREIAGQNTIFSVPTIIFYFEGSESFRESRNINLPALREKLTRPYEIFFG